MLDLDVDLLKDEFGDAFGKAYADVQSVLGKLGFSRSQGNVYVGNETVDAVKCVLAAMELSSQLPWFADCARDVHMLRIEETSSLMQAVRRASQLAAEAK